MTTMKNWYQTAQFIQAVMNSRVCAFNWTDCTATTGSSCNKIMTSHACRYDNSKALTFTLSTLLEVGLVPIHLSWNNSCLFSTRTKMGFDIMLPWGWSSKTEASQKKMKICSSASWEIERKLQNYQLVQVLCTWSLLIILSMHEDFYSCFQQ